jgi:hypothetical protein
MDAAQMTCPKCGWARELGAVECPACGIVYARYGGGPPRSSPVEIDPLSPPPLPPSAPLNPYAPPQSNPQSAMIAPYGQVFSEGGVWRAGDLLVMQKGASLPNRCLVCNQPAAVQFPKKLYWHHPGLYFLVISPLIYIIVAMIVRKQAALALPLCAEHAAKRKKSATTAALLMVLGFVLMLGSCTQIEGNESAFALILLTGFALLVVGAIVNNVGANLVVPKKIDDYYTWLRKVSSSYLATLPPAPPGL